MNVTTTEGTIDIHSLVWLSPLSGGQPWWTARDPRYPGCMSDGATMQEALQNLEDARREWLQSLAEDGLADDV